MRATLRGPRVRLRPLDERDSADLWRSVQDPELRRLTGTHRVFSETDTDIWCRSRGDAPGRYDWAIEASSSRASSARGCSGTAGGTT